MELIIPSPHNSQLTKQKEQTILVSNLGSLVIERFNWARKDFFTKNNTTKMYQIAAKKKVRFISFHKMKFHEFQLIEISWKKLHFMELIGWMTEIIETITSQFSIDKTEGTKKSGVNFGGLCDRTFQRYNSAGEDPKETMDNFPCKLTGCSNFRHRNVNSPCPEMPPVNAGANTIAITPGASHRQKWTSESNTHLTCTCG